MKSSLLFILFLTSIATMSDSYQLLNEINKSNIIWQEYDIYDNNQKISTGIGNNVDVTFIKVEKQVNYKVAELLSVIMDIDSYDEIISNKNISTHLVKSYNDTLYAYQLISNMIPFVRERQYIFKMYKISDNKLVWYLLEKDDEMLSEFVNEKVNTLTLGAGSWEMNDKNILKKII